MLDQFCDLDMIDQIVLLESIRDQGDVSAIPSLIALYAERVCDTAVDEMLYHTLFALLALDPAAARAGLAHESPRVRRLCIRCLGKEPVAGGRQALLHRLRQEADAELLAEIIRALEIYGDAAMVDDLLPFVAHPDASVAGLAIQLLARIGDGRVCVRLCNRVARRLAELGPSDDCDLWLGLAIQELRHFRDPEVISLLTRNLRHPNPVVRRLVGETLVCMGTAALPALGHLLGHGGLGEKIVAARILGKTGETGATSMLTSVLEGPAADTEPLLKFSVYQALGNLGTVRSKVGLVDGLEEGDELALIAVLHGLELLDDPAVADELRRRILRGDEQAERILRALVVAKPARLFAVLASDPAATALLCEAVRRINDSEAVALLRRVLQKQPQHRESARCLESLPSAASLAGSRLLVADESAAMRSFYQSAAAGLGVEVLEAADGLAALQLLRRAADVHCLVTELVMERMSGFELVREVRRDPRWQRLPVLVATEEDDPAQHELIRTAGADAVLVKPFGRDLFRRRLKELLQAAG